MSAASASMTREELLAYVQLLEQQVREDGTKIDFLNGTVRKLEADAVVTVAALVHVQGDQAILLPSVLDEIKDYQIARSTREDGATVFVLRKRPAPEQVEAPAEPSPEG